MGKDDVLRLTPDFERTLRRYVLGDLEERLRLELEELLLTDADAFEALGVVEDELIEEYLDESGSPGEREAFERHFLDSPERLERLRFARALRTRASKERVQARAATRPAWLGLAALLMVSLAGNFWMARQLGNPPPTPAVTASADVAVPERASVATFALSGGLLRAGGSLPHVTIPEDAMVVRLRLELPSNDYPLYRAAILDGEGEEIWSASKLGAEQAGSQTAIVLALASGILPPGDYQVKVSGVASSGEREALGSFPFRVARE